MSCYWYALYGLSVRSAIPLPFPADGGIGRHGRAPDIEFTIERNSIPSANDVDLENLVRMSPDGEVTLSISDVAKYVVTGGRKIAVFPCSSADEDSVRIFLLGSALGTLLLQRRYLVIHGNAIEVQGKCLVCVGESGAGKSSLAAAFARVGYRVLADDITPVTPDGLALPGIPVIKLWQDAAEHFGHNLHDLRSLRREVRKFYVPLDEMYCGDPRPVRWIFNLVEQTDGPLRVSEVHGLRKFKILHDNTYRNFLIGCMRLQKEHMTQVSRLSDVTVVADVVSPRAGFQFDELLDGLLSFVDQCP